MTATATLPRETLTCKGSNHVPGCEHMPRPPASQTLLNVALAKIDIGPNVRVDVAELEELTASIREHGVLQPVKVVEGADGTFRLVWGQRRVLAARAAGLVGIPAIIVDPDGGTDVANAGAKRSIEQLVENLHRADLNPVDRARAMRDVVDAGMTQADLARELGLHSSTIANDLGILDAPPKILEHVAAGRLTASHAKAMKGLAPSTQKELAARAVAQGLSAHGLEEEVQRVKRTEEWQKQRDAEAKKLVEREKASYAAGIAKLEAKKVPKDAPIRIVDHGGAFAKAIGALLAKAGYTDVETVGYYGVAARSTAAGCNCTAWKVQSNYGALTVAPACISAKHQQAKTQLEDDKRTAKYRLQERVRGKLAELAPGMATVLVGGQGVGLDPVLARASLWDALGYRVADWAEQRGGKRGNPWPTIVALSDAELATELGKAIAYAFNDNYGYHVPWADLGVELGIPLEEPKPAPKRKAAAAK